MTNDVREDSTMTMQTIDTTDPAHLRSGDVVTLYKGEIGEPGYRVQVRTVAECDSTEDDISLPEVRHIVERSGYRITEVRREVPDLPDHAGALAFTDKGLAVNEEKEGLWWLPTTLASKWDWRSELLAPVAATPVPSKELAELLAETRNGSNVDIAAAALNFASVCRREWERAGVPAPEVAP